MRETSFGMRETSFGSMQNFNMKGLLQGKFELMYFNSVGRPHTHKTVEIAVCVGGSGVVLLGDDEIDGPGTWEQGRIIPVVPGTSVEIPEGMSHHMRPDTGETLAMMIFYRALTVQTD